MAAANERIFAAQPAGYGGQKVIASPFQYATTDDDNLQIVSANSLVGVVLAIQGRRVTTAGQIEPFAFTHTPNSDRTIKTENYKLGAGALMNLTIFAVSGSPTVGQTYVMARLIRGLSAATIVLGGLLGGIVTANQHLAYPGSPIQSIDESLGCPRVVTGTQPGFGSDCAEAVPTGASWELLLWRSDLTTSAVPNARTPMLEIRRGGVAYFSSTSTGSSAAGEFRRFYWEADMPLSSVLVDSYDVAGLSSRVRLRAGDSINTNTNRIDIGDRWSAPTFYVNERLDI